MGKQNKYRDIHIKLIEDCRKGSKKAQFEIYKRYYKAMFNVCNRIVNDQMEAEEVMHDAFLKAFRNLDSFSCEVSFGAWLRKIMINQSLDNLRKRKIDFEPLNDKIEDSTFFEPDNTKSSENYDIQAIRDELLKLPEGYRIVLSLYLLEGYDHDEIGEILNISASTSRSQFYRARQKLIQNLKKKENGNV